MKAHTFQVLKSINYQFYWVYYDGNNEAIVTSETYVTLQGARNGLTNFIQEMGQYFK